MNHSYKTRTTQVLPAILLALQCGKSLAFPNVTVPIIEVADCLHNDPNITCTRSVTNFGNGVSTVSYDADISSEENGVHLRGSVDIDAAAGGGLEPAFSITASASTSDKSVPVGTGGEARIRWPYIIEAAPDVANPGARTVAFDFNYSIDVAGYINFRIVTPYISKYSQMSRSIMTDGSGNGRCMNHNGAVWTCSEGLLEGSGTLSILAPLNQEFYIDVFGRAGPGNTDWLDSTDISVQTAFDPFPYLVLDSGDLDAAKLSLATIRGLNDNNLLAPQRGSALEYVPIPPAALLFGSALGIMGLIASRARKRQ